MPKTKAKAKAEPKPKLKKVSDWLSKFSGHSALWVEKCRETFEKETGKPWPEQLTGRPVQELLAEGKRDFKGLQVWEGPSDAHVMGGWVAASVLADIYAKGFSAFSIGRGSAFRECLDALIKAGN
jgi:hypothetical protein